MATQRDMSKIGRFRDSLAYWIMRFALERIATPWYSKLISGSIRLGLAASRDKDFVERVMSAPRDTKEEE